MPAASRSPSPRSAIPFLAAQLEGGRATEKFSRPTMEKAAVACAAIENFYDDLYKTMREREQRRQTLEQKMQQKALPADEKERWRKQLQSQVRWEREGDGEESSAHEPPLGCRRRRSSCACVACA